MSFVFADVKKTALLISQYDKKNCVRQQTCTSLPILLLGTVVRGVLYAHVAPISHNRNYW